MDAFPSGTITFLFTDIEGSTRLWEEHPEAMRGALAAHDALLRKEVERHGGHLFKTVGDSVYAAFADPRQALAAARAAQERLLATDWPVPARLRVRMAVHTGSAESQNGDYIGPTLNRIARILSAGHGGQILLSEATRTLVEGSLPPEASLRDHGQHRLKDLAQPERLFQLVVPGLVDVFPPLRTLDAFPNNLPRQLTSFIGRDREMEDVKRLIRSSALLTLTGLGGSGKTRLALQVAADLVEAFPDGVWLVGLEALADPALIPPAIAGTLGVREEIGRSILDTLVDYLRPRSVLLLLDNCEHVVEACARVADTLLRACPNLRILATSQERLGVSGEVAYPVQPLAMPDPAQPATPEQLMHYAAAQLFVERARLGQPRFALTDDNAAAVAQVVHRLDGIPLALELAAARVKVLSVDQIAARLEDRFRLLTGGGRMEVARHQTLRAVLDWSYSLLMEEERKILRLLSVFAGGFTLEAAEAICAQRPADVDVLDLLSRLVEKSLVVFDDAGPEPRYRLLETVRLYGAELLRAEGEEAAARGRHRDWYLQLAEQAEPALSGPEQKVWLDRLEAEHDNFRATLAWSRSEADGVEAGLRLAGALAPFWDIRGYWREGREWQEAMLAKAGEVDSPARVKVLNAAANFALFQGDHEQSVQFGEASLALSRKLGDRQGTATCLTILGFEACRIENYTRAREYGNESLQLNRELGDSVGAAGALAVLGLVERGEGNAERAMQLLEESLRQLRAMGDQVRTSVVLLNLGLVHRDRGDYGRAQRMFEEALGLFQTLGDRWGTAFAQSNLGIVAWNMGEFAQAAELFRQSLVLRKALGEKRGISTSITGLGVVAIRQGQARRAAVLLGAAEALREAVKVPPPPFIRDSYDSLVASLKEALPGEVFQSAWAEGRGMDLERAIEFAMEDEDSGRRARR